MSTQFDPLEITAPELHRFWFMLSDEQQWYAIMREARGWFGTYGRRWRSMSKVRRKLERRNHSSMRSNVVPVWFEVPDPRFSTWISVKMSLQVQSDAKYQSGK
jgi:hypothetical protein